MKTKLIRLACFLTALLALAEVARAQGTAFTYQGRLTENGAPATGTTDLTITLYDAASGGAAVGVSNVINDLAVSNGLFTVALDFGAAAFDGNARWLEIAVRPGASAGAYTNLTPRQQITATPYALRALSADSATSATTATSVTAGGVSNPALANDAVDGAKILNGSITGADLNASLLNGTFWNLGGNTGTAPGVQFLGTTDNQPLEFKVNGQRGLRLEPTAGAPNVIGGATGNQITAPSAGGGILSGSSHRIYNGSDHSVIAGGFSNRIQISSPGGFIGGGQFNWIVNTSTNSVIAGGAANQVTRDHSFIGGGLQQTNRSAFTFIGGGKDNVVDSNSDYSAISAGRDNTIAANSLSATIAGGYLNDIGTNSGYSAVGGGINNDIAANSLYATIAGGGANDIGINSDYSAIGGGRGNNIAATSPYATIAGGYFNEILNASDYSVIAGGYSNRIDTVSDYSTISGGRLNAIAANSLYATIAGGYLNDIGTNSDHSAISGGNNNHIAANAMYATIVGGQNNSISTNSGWSVIGGGEINRIASTSRHSTIVGGRLNEIGLSSTYSTILGGLENVIGTNADWCVIGGGFDNAIADNSDFAFAAGRKAKANHTGAFVWGDSQDADLASQRDNQFRVRADGGARFDFNAGEWVDLRYQSNFVTSARIINTSSGGYLSLGGTWVNASDRERKTHFAPVDPQAVLAKVAAMPLSEWSYRTEGESVRHVGPMAQDFHAAFGLGGDDKSITTVDADGVALAAIQGLNEKVEVRGQKSEDRIQKLETENAALKQRLDALENIIRNQKSN